MRYVSALTVICAVVLSAAAPAQQLESDVWTAEIGDARLEGLAWRGEEIIQRAGLGGYQPEWAGNRFALDGADVTVGETRATWAKDEPGNQQATMALELTPESALLTLDTTIEAAGPTEFWVEIAPEAVCAEHGCFLWAGGDQVHTLPADEPFEKIRGLDVLRFQTPQRTVTIRCDGFELQDRRDRGSGLFLVQVISSGGVEPREVTRTIEVSVDAVPEEQIAGRRELVSQVATERVPMEIANAGFEDGLEGWSHGATASVDEAIVHAEERAARLEVPGEVEERSNVYITRMIPVEERHVYRVGTWIRGENVRPLTQGGMGAVGATIIMEFADVNGDWFASGNYAESSYETFDWRQVHTEAMRAPEGTGYAIIYLALRGVGTAWFDGVTMEEVRITPVLLSPMAGATLHDNTPTLDWQFNRETWSRVELSRDPQFPAGATRVMEHVASPPVTVAEPLEQGTWHWRVHVPEYSATSATWRFEQTASVDEDTTEPEIARDHDYLATPRAPMRFSYSDNVGVETVRLDVDGRDVSAAVEAGVQSATYTPDEPWTEGLHVATLQVEDAAGNAAEREVFFTHSEPVPRIVWERIGGLTIEGEPHFLLGMYGVNIEDMPEIAAGGFDFVHTYTWDGSGDTESALEYLDAAQSHGLRVFMGLSRARLQAYDERFVAERVAALMGHPGLLAWYLYDEPDLAHQYVSPMWLERYYELIKSLDPFHPVVVTCARDDAVERYRDALDVHWTQVYGSTAKVANRLELHRSMLREETPLSGILHCYDRTQTSNVRGGGEFDPEQFQPDGRLMRANAFMALAHNSSNLEWWWWGYGGGDRYVTVANAPDDWASLQQTVADIRSLEPVLTAAGEITTAVLEPAEDVEVHVWEKRLDDRVVMIAVNRDEATVEVRVTPQAAPTGSVEVLFEGREVEPAGGEIVDVFEARDVHVYQWRVP